MGIGIQTNRKTFIVENELACVSDIFKQIKKKMFEFNTIGRTEWVFQMMWLNENFYTLTKKVY